MIRIENLDERKERSEKLKNRLDPMTMLGSILDKQREVKDKQKKLEDEKRKKDFNLFSRRNNYIGSSSSSSQSRSEKPKEKERKEEKKSKKEKKEKKGKKEKKEKKEKKPSIEDLRAIRLEREKKERARVAAMIYTEEVEMGKRTPVPSTPVLSQNEREHPYHNQYYPSLHSNESKSNNPQNRVRMRQDY
eukprot:TRINITY_DN7739_c0_g1_i2.p1 TRINITY_DN7739_c0_g1~~TRINITY_DN7739_c0_g1_i2.p1  ORF type:complete len:190 (+),score=91.62 TRINITY_DN7739_c0_g1_i2:31-600(+)